MTTPTQTHMAFEDEWEQLELLTEEEQLALEEKDNRELELLFNDEGLTEGQIYWRRRWLREGHEPKFKTPTGIKQHEGESRLEYQRRRNSHAQATYRRMKRINQGLPPPRKYTRRAS